MHIQHLHISHGTGACFASHLVFQHHREKRKAGATINGMIKTWKNVWIKEIED